METFKEHLTGPNGFAPVKWVEEKASKLHTQHMFLLKTAFHHLLWLISFTSLMMILTYEIYSGGGPSTNVYCVVYYHVIAAPGIRSVGCVFAHLLLLMIRNAPALWAIFAT